MHLSKAPWSLCRVSQRLGLHTLLGEQKGLATLMSLLDVCEDLECTPPVLDFKLKWPGLSSRK